MEDDRVRQVGGKVEFKIAGEGRFRPQTGGGGGWIRVRYGTHFKVHGVVCSSKSGNPMLVVEICESL